MTIGADIRPGNSVRFAGTAEWRTVESVQSDPYTGSLLDVRVSPLPNLPSVYSVARVQPVALRTTLAPEMFVMARRGYACVRLLPTVDVTLCGRLGDGPAEFRDPRSPRYVTDQCAACDAAYSARHGHLPRLGFRA